MKKILILVMSLILLGGMAFGEGTIPDTNTSKSLVIRVTVPAMAELKIHQTAGVDTMSEFNGISSSIETHEFGNLDNDTDAPATVNSGTYYLSVKTNAKTITYIKASFSKMTGKTDSGNTLDYTLKYGASLNEERKTSTDSVEDLLIFTIPATNGARVVSTNFRIDISGTDIKTAVPDSYSATITFEYTTT